LDEYFFKFGENRELVLKKPKGSFTPTGTTDALIKAANIYLKKPGKLLDLGCGIGVAGLALHQLGWVKEPLYASDIGRNSVEVLQQNAKVNNCSIVAKQGSIFDPWLNDKFDIIINDISGVAQQVAEVSPWFDGVECESGEDGTKLVTKVIKEACNFLNDGGLLFFPVISLSNKGRILAVAHESFKVVERLSRNEWPLPKEMFKHAPLLRELKSSKKVSFDENFGMIIWSTEIYVAHN
jgi:ribosomal protein L11 methylase PrmA